MSHNSSQATIHRFDEETLDGDVIMDNGRVLPFSSDVMRRSALRTLRVGQRLNFELGPEGIERLWIDGIGQGQRIS